MVQHPRDDVTQDPEVCSGDAVLKGTRHRVHQVADLHRQGVTDEEFCEEYELTAEQVKIAVLYDRHHPRLGQPASTERSLRNIVEHIPDRR